MKVQFKFKAQADEAARREVLAALRGEGVRGIRALFPGDKHEELRRLYIADVPDASLQKRALSLLKRSGAVEFAEPEVVRKLIR